MGELTLLFFRVSMRDWALERAGAEKPGDAVIFWRAFKNLELASPNVMVGYCCANSVAKLGKAQALGLRELK